MRPIVLSTMTRTVAAISLIGAMAGCASMSPTPEEAVRTRATQSWKALVASDFDRSYEFLTPSYRAATTLNNYKKGFSGAVRWVAAEVASVKCESPDKCVANMKVEAVPILLGNRRAAAPIVNYFDETWLMENGQWWLFPTP